MGFPCLGGGGLVARELGRIGDDRRAIDAWRVEVKLEGMGEPAVAVLLELARRMSCGLEEDMSNHNTTDPSRKGMKQERVSITVAVDNCSRKSPVQSNITVAT